MKDCTVKKKADSGNFSYLKGFCETDCTRVRNHLKSSDGTTSAAVLSHNAKNNRANSETEIDKATTKQIDIGERGPDAGNISHSDSGTSNNSLVGEITKNYRQRAAAVSSSGTNISEKNYKKDMKMKGTVSHQYAIKY